MAPPPGRAGRPSSKGDLAGAESGVFPASLIPSLSAVCDAGQGLLPWLWCAGPQGEVESKLGGGGLRPRPALPQARMVSGYSPLAPKPVSALEDFLTCEPNDSQAASPAPSRFPFCLARAPAAAPPCGRAEISRALWA